MEYNLESIIITLMAERMTDNLWHHSGPACAVACEGKYYIDGYTQVSGEKRFVMFGLFNTRHCIGNKSLNKFIDQIGIEKFNGLLKSVERNDIKKYYKLIKDLREIQ